MYSLCIFQPSITLESWDCPVDIIPSWIAHFSYEEKHNFGPLWKVKKLGGLNNTGIVELYRTPHFRPASGIL